MKSSKRKLTLWLYEPHEMAELKDGNHTLHFGNYWDFHAGCHGTEMRFADGSTIDFDEEWTDEINQPWSVAKMVADKIGAVVITKRRKTPFNC
jgi:hypothetical protein